MFPDCTDCTYVSPVRCLSRPAEIKMKLAECLTLTIVATNSTTMSAVQDFMVKDAGWEQLEIHDQLQLWRQFQNPDCIRSQ